MSRRYRLTALLEESALAQLYKAAAEGLGPADVLVKLFTPRASLPNYARALSRVAARVRSLGHPFALGFDEVGFVGDRLAAVRAFVDGHNLGEALRRLALREIVLPTALGLHVVSEAAQIVSAAHACGWCHGAVTPGNIFLGKDGRVRVVDFGTLEAMSGEESLKALAGKGRSAYRAPELRQAGLGGPAADVYSLGAIAYELITLREVAAARGQTLSTKRDALLPPSRVDRRLNARIDGPVMRALDLVPSRRYRTAADLGEALRGLFAVLGHAPSQADVARFVRDLFPDDVGVAARPGALAVEGPFTLEELVPDATPASERTEPGQPDGGAERGETAPWSEMRSESTTAPLESLGSLESWIAPPALEKVVPEASAGPSEDAGPGSLLIPPPPTRRKPSAEPTPTEQRDTRPEVRASEAGGDSETLHDAHSDSATIADWETRSELALQARLERWRGTLRVLVVAAAAGVLLAVLAWLGFARRPGAEAWPADVDEAELSRGSPGVSQGARTAPAPARVTIEADAPAVVLIDGVDTGMVTPVRSWPVQPGRRAVTVLLRATNERREFTVDFVPGEEKHLSATFERPGGKRVPKRTGP